MELSIPIDAEIVIVEPHVINKKSVDVFCGTTHTGGTTHVELSSNSLSPLPPLIIMVGSI